MTETSMSIDMLRMYYSRNPIVDGLETAMRTLGVTSVRVAEMLLSASPVGAQLTARERAAVIARWYEVCQHCGYLLRWLAPPADRARYAPGYWSHVSFTEISPDLHPDTIPNLPVLGDRPLPPHFGQGGCDCLPPLDYHRSDARYDCAALGHDQPFPPAVEIQIGINVGERMHLVREQAADGVARAEAALYRVRGIKNYPEALKIAVRTLETIAAGKPAMHPEPEPEHPEPAGQLPDPVVTEYPEPGRTEGVEHPA
jgi:hypothetical protein